MPSRALACLLGPALLPALIHAQERVWRLPAHGVAIYEQTSSLRGEWKDGRGGISVFDAMSTMVSPLVFADELADGGRRWRDPWSLESIPLRLAFDLEHRSARADLEYVFERIHSYGRVTFTGRIDDPGPGGWQVIEGRLGREDVGPRTAGAPARQLEVDRHYMKQALDVRLVVRRRCDNGLVHEVRWSIDGELSTGDDRRLVTVSGERSWRLAEVLENRFDGTASAKSFGARVAATRDECAARQLYLLARMEGPLAEDEDRGALHGPALQAAMLFGLSRAGRRVRDPAIEPALRGMLERPLKRPNGRAFAILAIAGLHAPLDDRAARAEGRLLPIDLPKDMQAAMQARTASLQRAAIHRRSDAGDIAWWAFDGMQDGDVIHDSGVCVLALDAATRCGIVVPDRLFEAHARFLLARGVDAGAAPAPLLGLERAPPGDRPATSAADRQTGWTGSRRNEFTTAGRETVWAMAALACCRRHTRDEAMRADIDGALRRGWAWLSHHFTARHAPGPFEVARQWRGDFVMGLAWLLDETGVRWLDDRDVYFEQAMVLLADSRQGTVASSVTDTPAALAFWRDSTARR